MLRKLLSGEFAKRVQVAIISDRDLRHQIVKKVDPESPIGK